MQLCKCDIRWHKSLSTYVLISFDSLFVPHTAGLEQASGQKLQKFGEEHLKKVVGGKLKVGERCLTEAGALPYLRVLHLVTPATKGDFAAQLTKALAASFQELLDTELRSVAMTLVGAGIFFKIYTLLSISLSLQLGYNLFLKLFTFAFLLFPAYLAGDPLEMLFLNTLELST